jgi:hypothetical protein
LVVYCVLLMLKAMATLAFPDVIVRTIGVKRTR